MAFPPGSRAVYTEQMSFWLKKHQIERIAAEALEKRISKSEVARGYLERGYEDGRWSEYLTEGDGQVIVVSISPDLRRHLEIAALVLKQSLSATARDLIAAGMAAEDES